MLFDFETAPITAPKHLQISSRRDAAALLQHHQSKAAGASTHIRLTNEKAADTMCSCQLTATVKPPQLSTRRVGIRQATANSPFDVVEEEFHTAFTQSKVSIAL